MNKVPFKHILTASASAAAGAFLYCEQNCIEISRYKLHCEKFSAKHGRLRIVHLSDLHNKTFGKNNRVLLKKVSDLCPDIVLLTGDMVSHGVPDLDGYLRFAKHLAEDYPVYYVNGNHECSDLDDMQKKRLADAMENAGAVCVDNDISHLSFYGETIDICGICYEKKFYRGVREHRFQWEEFTPDEMNRIAPKRCDDHLTLLLAHNPLDFDVYAEWGADVSFGGHVHGGLVRLPYIGGILSPERKLMPRYKEGIYEKNGHYIAVSRGLGELRLFNRPEIVCVDIYGKEC